MSAPRAILLDYGATLDTAGIHWVWVLLEAWSAAGLKLSFSEFREAYIAGERTLAAADIAPRTTFRQLLEMKVAAQISALALDFAHAKSVKLQAAVVDYCHAYASRCTADARAVLEPYAKRVPIGIVSNFYGNLAAVMSEFGLDQLFTSVTDSTAVRVRKPHPKIFNIALKSLCLSSLIQREYFKSMDSRCEAIPYADVLMVGDNSRVDLAPAAALGMRTAHITGRPWPGDDAVDHFAADYSGTLAQVLAAAFSG